jgi:hypothetical protein
MGRAVIFYNDGALEALTGGPHLSCELLSTPAACILHLHSKNRQTLTNGLQDQYSRVLMPPLWSSPCSPLGSGRGSGRILVTGDLETRLLAVSLHSFLILNNAELPHIQGWALQERNLILHFHRYTLYYRYTLKRQTLKILLLDANCTLAHGVTVFLKNKISVITFTTTSFHDFHD